MVYTVFYKTSSFAGYCFLDKNSIHPKRYGVFSFKTFKAVLVKIQICSFIVIEYKSVDDYMHRGEGFQPLPDGAETPFDEAEGYRQEEMPFD